MAFADQGLKPRSRKHVPVRQAKAHEHFVQSLGFVLGFGDEAEAFRVRHHADPV
jgi:hypothetical protein